MLSPYWFLETPLDTEHKYYILMGYLAKIKDSLSNQGFEKKFKKLLIIKRDLITFAKSKKLSSRSFNSLSDKQKTELNNILNDDNYDDVSISQIVQNSKDTIDVFIEEHKEIYEKYNSLANIIILGENKNFTWDQGFLVFHKENEEFLKLYNWFFSVIKIEGEDTVALLLNEMRDVKCKYTSVESEIKDFIINNIKEYSEAFDCILIGEISKTVDSDIGIEIGKEKSINIIMDRFKTKY